jgi:molecular chaperone GrpE
MTEEKKEFKREDKKPAAEASAAKELNIEELRKKLADSEKKAVEYLAGWQRERADFLNYKRDEWERLGGILKFAGEGLILKILPILDNFEIVTKKLPDNLINNENIKGLLQIKNQIKDFLKIQGVEEVESLGKKFDPSFMEAVEEVNPASASAEVSAGEAGIVIEEIQKGYKLHGKVLRPARVKTSK